MKCIADCKCSNAAKDLQDLFFQIIVAKVPAQHETQRPEPKRQLIYDRPVAFKAIKGRVGFANLRL